MVQIQINKRIDHVLRMHVWTNSSSIPVQRVEPAKILAKFDRNERIGLQFMEDSKENAATYSV